ncbi:MAG: hypothetical protein KAU94_06735, partial [Verrucomicrobia bacterium]|nr:hypothetical protein [Verrucomicrobiota bacterium]
MKSPPRLILLDSNAYLRLAVSIHPLLGQRFGRDKQEQNVIRVIQKLDQEYDKNPRLKNKFHWVKDDPYAENRRAERLNIAPKQQKEVDQAVSYIWTEERNSEYSLSPVDVQALAIGFVKQCPVVTDDIGMQEIGKLLDIETWSTIQLLRLMQTEELISLEKCIEIVRYLDH